MPFGNKSGDGGGGGTTTVIRPSEYTEVANETKQLTKDDQYVRVKSDSANTVITLPPTSTVNDGHFVNFFCLLYTSPSPRDRTRSRMPSSA